jgi:NTF2 fold immunity protein
MLREEKCMAAEILQQHGLRLNAIREELARSLAFREQMAREQAVIPRELGPDGPELAKSGAVPDAVTAKRIAEALWIPKYGADTVARQQPILVELKFNVWIVTGTSSAEAPLFAFILQADARILSVGGPTKP